jgi:hypothetical protein
LQFIADAIPSKRNANENPNLSPSRTPSRVSSPAQVGSKNSSRARDWRENAVVVHELVPRVISHPLSVPPHFKPPFSLLDSAFVEKTAHNIRS